MKDPAFLFYSKDFYEGTRMMLPEERACYIDLLIYQHQNGNIPIDLKRVQLYCSGINEATLKATLEAKFILNNDGYYNERLKNEILGREKFKNNQSENGKVGQFWKKAKQILKVKDFNKLLQLRENKDFILTFISENEINIDTLQGLLKHCLNNKVNVSANENENENEIVKENEPEIKIEKAEILTKFDQDFELLIEIFNDVRHTDFKSTGTAAEGLKKNYAYWLSVYSNEEIETAIRNIPNDKFWKDKITPTILLRQKNSNKEAVDYIGGLLNQKSKNIAFS
jgi:uncharacterized protein YdaU (DUF1376 family)